VVLVVAEHGRQMGWEGGGPGKGGREIKGTEKRKKEDISKY